MKQKLKIKMIFLNWRQLKFLPNNRLIKSMYYWFFIVPIAANLMSNVDNPVIIKFEDYLLKLDFSLPFSWYVFFFSALFFSLGNMFYMFWCPSIIKEHLAFAGFLNDGKTVEHLEQYAKEISIDFVKLRQEVNYSASGGHTELKKLFWPIFENAKTARQFRNYLCAGSYYIGFGLAIWIVISNIWYVSNALIS